MISKIAPDMEIDDADRDQRKALTCKWEGVAAKAKSEMAELDNMIKHMAKPKKAEQAQQGSEYTPDEEAKKMEEAEKLKRTMDDLPKCYKVPKKDDAEPKGEQKEPRKDESQWEISINDVRNNRVKLHRPLFCRAVKKVDDPVAKEFVNVSMARMGTGGDGRCGIHALAGWPVFQGAEIGYELFVNAPAAFIKAALKGAYAEVKARLPISGQNILNQIMEGL